MKEQIQKNKDKKQKYAYWMRPSLVDEMTEMLESANATSKSDFVCQAVEFYIGYLRQQKNIDYLSPILAGVIRDEVESVEKNVCEMLSKPNSAMRSQPTVIIQRKPCSCFTTNAPMR